MLVPNKINADDNMFANINFVVETHENVPVVSRDSLLKYDGKFYVYVIEDGKAVRRPVRTGITQDTTVEILAGLKSGETIISGHRIYKRGRQVSVASGTIIYETSEIGVKWPVTTSMIFIAIIILGGFIYRVGLDLMPDFDIPVVTIITAYPGAGLK